MTNESSEPKSALFDILSDTEIEQILRLLSSKPRHPNFASHVPPTTLIAALQSGKSLPRVIRNLVHSLHFLVKFCCQQSGIRCREVGTKCRHQTGLHVLGAYSETPLLLPGLLIGLGPSL